MYYGGFGVAKDDEKAKELYRMAASEDKNAELLLKELEMEQKEKAEGGGGGGEGSREN